MRDHLREVMGATYLCIEGSFDFDVVEPFAVRHALKILLEADFSRIVLKSDCNKLITHL